MEEYPARPHEGGAWEGPEDTSDAAKAQRVQQTLKAKQQARQAASGSGSFKGSPKVAGGGSFKGLLKEDAAEQRLPPEWGMEPERETVRERLEWTWRRGSALFSHP